MLANEIALNGSREDVFEVLVRFGVVVGQIEFLRVNSFEPWKQLKAEKPTEGGRGEVGGLVYLHYGQDPGIKFYTHVSDQFGPFHTKLIAATANEAPHVLDGLLYHKSSLVTNEHYTDTGGFSDHVFAMCHLLGFRFAPGIRDLKEKRLYILPGMTVPPELASLVAGAINLRVLTQRSLDRTAAPGQVDQDWNGHRFGHPAQTLGLPSAKRPGPRAA